MVAERGPPILEPAEEGRVHPAEIGALGLAGREGNLEEARRHRRDLDAEVADGAEKPRLGVGADPRHAIAVDAAELEMADALLEAELERRLRIGGHLVGDDRDLHGVSR